MSLNIPTNALSAAAVAARDAEYTGTPFTDLVGDGSYSDPYLGMNRSGSNAPGIGICTNVPDPTLDNWSVADQDEVARDPQNSSHIAAIDAAAPAYAGTGYPTPAQGAVIPITGIVDQHGTPDYNNTMTFIVADANAAPGAVFEVATGTVNVGGATIAIGDRAWGAVPVA